MQTHDEAAREASRRFADEHAMCSTELAHYAGCQWMAKRFAEQQCPHHEYMHCDDGDWRHLCHAFDVSPTQGRDKEEQ